MSKDKELVMSLEVGYWVDRKRTQEETLDCGKWERIWSWSISVESGISNKRYKQTAIGIKLGLKVQTWKPLVIDRV